MEQLAQFVTKSFEFNNCFSAKLLEAKQKTVTLDNKEANAANGASTGKGTQAAFLSFGLSSLFSSSSASNASSCGDGVVGSGNNSLLMDIDATTADYERTDDEASDCAKKSGSVVLGADKCARDKLEGSVEAERDEEEEEDEIDIETDSLSDLEDNKRLIIKTQERPRVIKPTDLRIRLCPVPHSSTPNQSPKNSDKFMDVNNNKKISTVIIRPPITKNWLIPDDTTSE